MKAVSGNFDVEFRQKSQSDLIARVLIDLRRFLAFSVDCRSNGLLARQTVPPIFSVLAFCCRCLSDCGWVEGFPFSVGCSDDIELVSSLVSRLLEMQGSLRLSFEVALCFAFSGLALFTSLYVDPFSFTPTFFLSGQAPNPPPKLSHNRLSLPRRERVRLEKSAESNENSEMTRTRREGGCLRHADKVKELDMQEDV